MPWCLGVDLCDGDPLLHLRQTCSSVEDTVAAVTVFLGVAREELPRSLLRVLDGFRRFGCETDVSFRGAAAAVFVFAERDGRSLEFYPAEQDALVVARGDAATGVGMPEELFSTADRAVQRGLAWLIDAA